jgi:hypothetical protein
VVNGGLATGASANGCPMDGASAGDAMGSRVGGGFTVGRSGPSFGL